MTVDRLRYRWFLAAVVAAVVVVVLDGASHYLVVPHHRSDRAAAVLAQSGVTSLLAGSPVEAAEVQQLAAGNPQPPGLAIGDLALIDGLLLFTVLLLAAPRAPRWPRAAVGLGSLVGAAALAATAVDRLRYLVGLYTRPPYGTLNYLIRFGFFGRGRSMALLTTVMVLKLAFCVALYLACRPVLPNRRIVAPAMTSLLATVFISFCYALVPETLMSITDALAAAVVAVTAGLWSLVLVVATVGRPRGRPAG